ncbi:16S rRNA-processing protein RimM [Proteiniphilum saccharofermentans]|uniref:Ribosome maturation factor RimM n=1 Tax=Proteiniphilum saccharofermentans TaxID=1642647 RepID=A0A1R3SVD5_9BACT|nr:ribosome maturation factor RimM [Proteiniphilum saccharofermentans]SCD19531.1 16S rRNA-processing protein RimM [Proteiniphilum saccharofermentans]SEA29319.1 16S rRNA processing protein RimM [Porphyromonadaceae bacterium KH3R12]SFS78838.1 16S rRNA processing protein RimM [Porphyromonadaceae bacterium NLAE-zl-C104]
MISRKDILQVGSTQKPYGIKGEIVIRFRKAEYADIDTEYYFLEIEGIPVPFFVEEFTYSTDVTARVKLEDVDDETAAARYVNTDIYLPRDLVKLQAEQETADWDYFTGFTVIDQYGKRLGIIEEVDNSTMNVLFVVKNDQKEYLIPATEDFIEAIDEEENLIEMFLPDGLIEE